MYGRRRLERLGLGVEALRSRHPRLILCNLMGFGRGGRYRDRPAYDTIIQGLSGVTDCNARVLGEPRFVPMVFADHIVGLIATQCILAALFAREKSGEGQAIEVPMFENVAAFVLAEHMGDLTFVPPRGKSGDARVLDPLAKPVATKDGYICVSANTDAQAFALFDAIGRPELKHDPRFSSVKARLANVRAYFEVRAAGPAHAHDARMARGPREGRCPRRPRPHHREPRRRRALWPRSGSSARSSTRSRETSSTSPFPTGFRPADGRISSRRP